MLHENYPTSGINAEWLLLSLSRAVLYKHGLFLMRRGWFNERHSGLHYIHLSAAATGGGYVLAARVLATGPAARVLASRVRICGGDVRGYIVTHLRTPLDLSARDACIHLWT